MTSTQTIVPTPPSLGAIIEATTRFASRQIKRETGYVTLPFDATQSPAELLGESELDRLKADHHQMHSLTLQSKRWQIILDQIAFKDMNPVEIKGRLILGPTACLKCTIQCNLVSRNALIQVLSIKLD